MEDNSLQGNQSTQLNKGLITDCGYSNQPEGSWSFALNLVNTTKEGNSGYIANEYGNSQCLNLTIDGKVFIPVGSINLQADEIVLFLATADQSDSRIIIQNGCNRTDVVYTIGSNTASCLNFSEYHPVSGIAKIRKGCNRVIYFRDSYNSDKSIDLDEILNSPNDNRYYNSTDGWNCGLFKLAPDFDFPCLSYTSTDDSGGNLKLGVYQFGIALGDEDLNFTSVLAATNTIPVTSGQLNNFYSIDGGDPLKENSPTTKSINLSLSNLDVDYPYARIYVIETISGVSTVYLADTIAVQAGTFNYTYRGVDLNSATVLTLADFNANTIVYDKSRSMEQQDQRLLKANLEERNIDYTAFQIAANKIKTRYVTKPIRYTDSIHSVNSGNYYVDTRSYMRDEVYALSVSGVFTDGTQTPEFHIPGRELNTATQVIPSTGTTTLPDSSDPYNITGTKEHNRKTPFNGWDSSEYNIVDAQTIPQTPVSPNYINNWNYPKYNGTWVDLAFDEVSYEDAKPLTKNIGDTIERWRLYNTCYREEKNTVYDTYYSKGQLAYWESAYDYPTTVSCTGERIYPTGKIRHHKMPDTTMEPHFLSISDDDNGAYILSLGLEFDLTDFIAELQSRLGTKYSEVQGFRISRVKRDRNNRTILDKGLAYRSLEMAYKTGTTTSPNQTNFILQNNYFNKHINVYRDNSNPGLEALSLTDYDQDNVLPPFETFNSGEQDFNVADFIYSTRYISLHNPRSQFLKETDYQYIKMEKELWGTYSFWGDSLSWDNNEQSRVSYWVKYNNYSASSNYIGTPMPYFTNRMKFEDYFTPSNQNGLLDTKQTIGRAFQENYWGKVDLYPDISNDGTFYGGGPQDLDGSTFNWQDILGHKIGVYKDILTPGVQLNSKAYYVSLKNYNPNIYNQLNTLTYYPIHSCLLSTSATTQVLFGGDCFISQVTSRLSNVDSVGGDSTDERSTYTSQYTYYVESEVNCKLRHQGYGLNNYAGWYYPKHGINIPEINDVIFKNDELLIGAGNSVQDAYVEGNYCYNQYNYNQDYSKEIGVKPNFPLPLGFDYCSQCLNKYPYRIVFSERSFQEDRSDSYRKFLANNYRDISAGTGVIANLFRESDTLFVRTEQSLWFIPTKQQEMKTDAGTIQIGTGEFFSLPPKELVSTTIGYNGGQTTLDLVVNEYGALYADANAGIVFLTKVGKGQQEISKEAGNRFWFRENLPFNLLKFLPDFQEMDAPTGKTGIGLLGYYDPEYRRYILTKKDYYPLYPDDSVYINDTHTWGVNVNGTLIFITDPYNSPLYFENKSWTISYSLEENMWLSWHSYLPSYSWNTRANFFTYKYGNNNTWKHGTGDFQTYYGTKYPHIFEFVNTKSPLQTKISNTLSYISDVQEYSPFTRQWVDIKNDTFNKGIFYNDTQSTGELDITVKNNNDPFASVLTAFSPGSIFAEVTEGNWSINNIRDMIDQPTPNQPIFTSDWVSIKNNYFIDKIPNSTVLNYLTKPQYEMEELRDSYMVSRLSYKNALNNRRIITKYLNNNFNYSIR
jgi:hypothetical protein